MCSQEWYAQSWDLPLIMGKEQIAVWLCKQDRMIASKKGQFLSMNCEFCLSYIKQPVDSFLFHCIDLSE